MYDVTPPQIKQNFIKTEGHGWINLLPVDRIYIEEEHDPQTNYYTIFLKHQSLGRVRVKSGYADFENAESDLDWMLGYIRHQKMTNMEQYINS